MQSHLSRQAPNTSIKLKDDLAAVQSASFCSADLSSFSSADLSSMIASWVDRNSCGEYEKELKVSSGMNFKTIAMRQHTSDKNSRENPRRNFGTTYQSCQEVATDDSLSSDSDWNRSAKRRCTYNVMDGQYFLRYENA